MQHCCVIGGTGFIGRYVVELLVAQERQITVIGRKPGSGQNLPRAVRYLCGDYGNRAFLVDALRDVDEIIDLAYSTVPKTSYDDPVQDILSNLPPVVGLLQVASDLAVRKMVIVSSGGTVYGIAQQVPITEEYPTHPISPYGITKLAVEKYALMFNQIRALPVVIVRPGNAFGERQRAFGGQGLIATAIASILTEKQITLFGSADIVRDYIHASDVARGIVAALDDGRPGSVYNIGTGVGRSNQEVLDNLRPFARSVGLDPQVRILPPRQFDVPVNVLDCRKLRMATGWVPSIAFRDGLERTWRWYYDLYNGRSAERQLPLRSVSID